MTHELQYYLLRLPCERMEYGYAVLLLDATEAEITHHSLARVLQSAGVTVDSTRMDHFLRQVESIDIDEIVGEVPGPPSHAVDEMYVYAALLLAEAGADVTRSALADVLQTAGASPTQKRVWDGYRGGFQLSG